LRSFTSCVPDPIPEGYSDHPIEGGQGSASFQITPSKDLWYCFKCQEGGNILDLVSKIEKCNIRTAGLKITEWFNFDDREEYMKNPARGGVLSCVATGFVSLAPAHPRRREKARKNGMICVGITAVF